MKPEWKTPSADDKRRFTRFVIEQLDAQLYERSLGNWTQIADTDPSDVDRARLARFIRFLMGSGLRPESIDRMGWLAGINIPEIARQIAYLRWHGFEVVGGEAPQKRGKRRAQTDAFYDAYDDVPRIRALFREFWNKRNRHEHPTAEEIAAERWGLSPEETAELIDRFQRKG